MTSNPEWSSDQEAQMKHPEQDLEKRLMAAALSEMRVLLAAHIGQGEDSVGAAADFAYALHNQALAILEGRPIDVHAALDSMKRLEPALGAGYMHHFRSLVLEGSDAR